MTETVPEWTLEAVEELVNEIHSSFHPYELAKFLVRGRIERGSYQPGDPISARAIAGELGYDDATVRKAFTRLSDDGLLILAAGKGSRTRVAEPLSRQETLSEATPQPCTGLASRETITDVKQEQISNGAIKVKPPKGPKVCKNQPMTEQKVREAFRLAELGWKNKQIANELSIKETTIRAFLRGQSWKHLGLKLSKRNAPPTRQEIAGAIRKRIADGDLKPGAIIPTTRLAAELNTTTSTMHKALRLVADDGLVTASAGRGARARVSEQ